MMLRLSRCTPLLLLLLFTITAAAQEVATTTAPMRVAMYDGTGVGRSRPKLLAVLEEMPNLKVEAITAEEIREGALAKFDVVVFPGGSGGKQGRTLEESGREQVRKFVRGGGGFVGICAGAYLASCDYEWSLRILDAKVLDKQHWARGYGDVELALTDDGRAFLGVDQQRITVYYHQGPLLAPAGDDDVDDYQCLSTFATEIAKNGAPEGVMTGATALAAGRFGKGRVFVASPHAELTDGQHGVIHRALRWVSGE